MPLISKEQALRLLEGSSTYSHSILVSKIMRVLAGEFGEVEFEWELVGLLHDLDYDLVRGDMSQHGVKAADILNGRLSERCLHAIRSHDHRTGIKPETIFDESLIFADSLAVLMEDQSINASAETSRVESALQKESIIKPWISENIFTYINKNKISFSHLIKIVTEQHNLSIVDNRYQISDSM